MFLSLYLPKFLYCYCNFWFCNRIFVFINPHPSTFISFFFFPLGRIQEIEFERHGLPLTIRYICDPFNISTYYLVLFVLQRVAFCFYFILSLATNTIITPDVIFHLTLFHYDDKRETGVGLTYRCHLSNITSDSTYNKWRRQAMTKVAREVAVS